MKRDEELQAELDRMVALASRDPSVERVMVFGSMAGGGAWRSGVGEESDLDLCIVQHTDERFLDRLASWIDRLAPRVAVDLLVYTPAEWADLSRTNPFVREEILAKGRAVHAA